jgi:hypothetical protein
MTKNRLRALESDMRARQHQNKMVALGVEHAPVQVQAISSSAQQQQQQQQQQPRLQEIQIENTMQEAGDGDGADNDDGVEIMNLSPPPTPEGPKVFGAAAGTWVDGTNGEAKAAAAAAAAVAESKEQKLVAPAQRVLSPKKTKSAKQLKREHDQEVCVEFYKAACFGGELFVKHGRLGKPHERLLKLRCTSDGDVVFDWTTGKLALPHNQFHVKLGKTTSVFQRTTAKDAKAELCFSIVSDAGKRSLDLEARNAQILELWTVGLNLLRKHNVLKLLRDRKRAQKRKRAAKAARHSSNSSSSNSVGSNRARSRGNGAATAAAAAAALPSSADVVASSKHMAAFASGSDAALAAALKKRKKKQKKRKKHK